MAIFLLFHKVSQEQTPFSSIGCLLLSHPQRFTRFSCNETPSGRQHALTEAVAFRFSRWTYFHALSGPLQTGLCLFQILPPDSPSARLTVMPAQFCIERCDGVNTFCIIDHRGQLRRNLNADGTLGPVSRHGGTRNLQPLPYAQTQGGASSTS